MNCPTCGLPFTNHTIDEGKEASLAGCVRALAAYVYGPEMRLRDVEIATEGNLQ